MLHIFFRFKLFQWNSVCAIYNSLLMKIAIYVNGEVSNYIITAKDGHENLNSATISNAILLSQRPQIRPMIGDFGELHIWDSVLSSLSVKAYEECDQTKKGNIFDWSKVTPILFNVTVEEMELNILCTPNIPGLTIIPQRATFDTTENLCDRFGGVFPAFRSTNEKTKIIKQYNETESCKTTSYIWSAFTDKKVEGKFVDKDMKELDYADFNRGEPNGGEYENCGSIFFKSGMHVDIGCWEKLCGGCLLNHLPKFELRGVFPKEYNYDRIYYWTRNLQHGKYIFEGIKHNKLVASADGHWNMIDIYSGETLISLENHNYPIGRYSWNDKVKNNTFILSFDSCNDKEFNCGTGNCIPLSKRCNEKKDCPDNTDEEDCASILLPEDYNLGVPPLGPSDSGSLMIEISQFDLNIDDIIDVENMIDIQFGIVSNWKDARVTYVNLNKAGPSILTNEEKNMIWMPAYTLWKANSDGLQEDFGFQTLTAYALKNGSVSDNLINVARVENQGKISSIQFQWFYWNK